MDTHAHPRDDPRTSTMTRSTNDNEKPMRREEPQRPAFERLREEITILRIEGALFCFDKHEARTRTGTIRNVMKNADGTERPVLIKIDSDYGQPSVLAYKIAQAIFLKMTRAGEPHPSVVAFTQRELMRLIGRSCGGNASRQLYHAMMQLKRTGIACTVFNKEKKTGLEFHFEFLSSALFSSKENAITECVVQVHDVIVNSLNRHHAIWLNYQKLSTLEPIAAVIYKRLFFHFSNTYTSSKGRNALKFEKDYEAICREWLGGLKPERYASRISKQLGRYLDAVQATGIILRYEITERVKGAGFKLVFYAGSGFFEDYTEFYLSNQGQQQPGKPTVPTTLDPQPLQLVAYFHQLLGHKQNTFADKEKTQAAELLRRYDEREVRDLIDYAVAKIKTSNFNPDFFGSIMNYQPGWAAHQSEHQEIARRRAAAGACPICEGRGWMLVKDMNGKELARQCNHGQTVPGSERPTAR
jgi:Replication initiator protein A